MWESRRGAGCCLYNLCLLVERLGIIEKKGRNRSYLFLYRYISPIIYLLPIIFDFPHTVSSGVRYPGGGIVLYI